MITKEEVGHVAHLARLHFSEEEQDKFTSQLNDILTYIDKLNQVDTAGIPPTTHAISLNNAFREDVVKESIGRDLALTNAPDEKGSCFRVPKVIE
ncbi:MAG: Asp-tRNA(Asn)/Glu-tRNA(Gln) amidotransferase subunit GatC [Proteobacteria bacterium]|nr:Asp-tRNA(Asn)/Glu-tRNA(Gln) amidotransferase subunit GatC [Pseudomonadota bacterium]